MVYLSNIRLPHEMLDKEFCMKFIMSSPNAPPMELMWAVQDSMKYVWIFILSIHHASLYLSKALDLPVITFNCKMRKEILIIPYLIFTASDNLMYAEQISQSSLNANYFCHTCNVVKTQNVKGPWVTEDQGDCSERIKTKGKSLSHCSKYEPD